MIERYTRKEIKDIWEDHNRYSIWLNIELAAAEAMEKFKIIPKGVSAKVKKKAKINVNRIHQIESKVHHDVIAFLTSVTEKVGPEGKFLHKGMTSSDVLDTAFNIQLIQASKIIIKDIDQILKVLRIKSIKLTLTWFRSARFTILFVLFIIASNGGNTLSLLPLILLKGFTDPSV